MNKRSAVARLSEYLEEWTIQAHTELSMDSNLERGAALNDIISLVETMHMSKLGDYIERFEGTHD